MSWASIIEVVADTLSLSRPGAKRSFVGRSPREDRGSQFWRFLWAIALLAASMWLLYAQVIGPWLRSSAPPG